MASDNTKKTRAKEETAEVEKTETASYGTEETPQSANAEKHQTAPDEKSGVFVYLGPPIRGVISYAAIHTGKRSEVIGHLSGAIEAYPQIERLIVEDYEVAAARKKIKAGGNLLAAAYSDLLKN